ncbi:MAG: tRNA (adenosine(37)-N6)-dimethylallyltransferase MiaA [Bacilli bacterium]|nr:tRNA (adenosine(37)-N6)-dimethylallyltransferase MiaA [Bacilli bacterium]
MKKVIIITGPTASGKTKLSLEIAKRLHTDLINGDAYQIYQGLDILTAKPTKEELKAVKHHLMDELNPLVPFSIFQYQKMVRNLVDKFEIPIIVGGSGLYIDSVIYDYRFEDEESQDTYFDSNYSNEELHDMLKELDLEKAKIIHPNNRKRVARAIHLAKTQDANERSLKHEHYYKPLIICLNLERDSLYERINQRVLEMLDNGLIEEVKNSKHLLNTQLGKAIGFEHTIKYLDGLIAKNELIDLIQKDSRHYAKRQLTWYRNHQDCIKIDVDLNNFSKTIEDAYQQIITFLKD